MHWSKETIVDTMLIVGGTGFSVLFISTDGNGQNPLPVAGSMLIVVFVIAVVSLSIAEPVRTMGPATPVSVLITDMLFVLYFLSRVAFAGKVQEHAGEEAFLLPMVFLMLK